MKQNRHSIILYAAAAASGLLPVNAPAHEEKSSAEAVFSASSGHAHSASESSIQVEVLPNHYHVAGNSIPTWMRLSRADGKPVTP